MTAAIAIAEKAPAFKPLAAARELVAAAAAPVPEGGVLLVAEAATRASILKSVVFL